MKPFLLGKKMKIRLTRKKKPIEERFFPKIERIPFSGCWIWMGGSITKGYGALQVGDKRVYIHRISYMIHKGEIPKGMQVCHTCDVPLCVNPDHLFLGTAKDNSDDKVRKGRQTRNESHPWTKIPRETILELRKIYIKGDREFGSHALSRKFNISQMQVWNVVNNNRRKD